MNPGCRVNRHTDKRPQYLKIHPRLNRQNIDRSIKAAIQVPPELIVRISGGAQLRCGFIKEEVSIADIQEGTGRDFILCPDADPSAVFIGHPRSPGFGGNRALIIGNTAAQILLICHLIGRTNGNKPSIGPVAGDDAVGLRGIGKINAQFLKTALGGPGGFCHDGETRINLVMDTK